VEPVSTLEAMAETARPQGPARVVAVLGAGRGELVCERFALDSDRARSLGPATLVRAEDVARFASGDRVVALGLQIAGSENDPGTASVAAALAAAVSRHPRPASVASGAIYSRPSAAEEKRGAP
jgi:tRNA A37 threonylcarbamoyladenosine modification protein TsaB